MIFEAKPITQTEPLNWMPEDPGWPHSSPGTAEQQETSCCDSRGLSFSARALAFGVALPPPENMVLCCLRGRLAPDTAAGGALSRCLEGPSPASHPHPPEETSNPTSKSLPASPPLLKIQS